MRLLRPGLVVFCVALLASLCVHLPVYTALGSLADVLLHQSEAAPKGPVEFELAALGEPAPSPKPSESDKRADKVVQKVTEDKPKPEPEIEHKQAEPAKKPPPKPDLRINPELAPPPPPPQLAPPPPPAATHQLAVTQKSDDPKAPPPDNARFIAEDNRRVTEETVASVTNMDVDQANPQVAPHASKLAETQGDSDKSDPADLHDVKGEHTRPADAREAQQKPRAPSEASHGSERAEALARAPSQGGSAGASQDKRALAAGSELVGGDEQTVVIDDGMGRIRIRRALPGHGPGNAGGERQRGAPTEQRAERAGARASRGVSLNLSFSQFEQTFGADELRAEREAYLEQRRSKSQGGNREVEWKQFRAAIENFVPNVKPGNQTALNAAASPFAAYLAEVHRLIHREFAFRFLKDLPLVGGPYNDPTLYTQLEIIINQDGTLHKVGVIQSSGFTPYDYGAWNSVVRAAPFPEPPKKILSGDGRVYMHWGFNRDERQCGTFNADPYILPNLGNSPNPSPGPMHDKGTVGPGQKLGQRKPNASPQPTAAVSTSGRESSAAWIRPWLR